MDLAVDRAGPRRRGRRARDVLRAALGAVDALGERAGDEVDAELARDRARPGERRRRRTARRRRRSARACRARATSRAARRAPRRRAAAARVSRSAVARLRSRSGVDCELDGGGTHGVLLPLGLTRQSTRRRSISFGHAEPVSAVARPGPRAGPSCRCRRRACRCWRGGRPLKRWRWVGAFGPRADAVRGGRADRAGDAPRGGRCGTARARARTSARCARGGLVVDAPRACASRGVTGRSRSSDGAPIEVVSPHGARYIWTRKRGGVRGARARRARPRRSTLRAARRRVRRLPRAAHVVAVVGRRGPRRDGRAGRVEPRRRRCTTRPSRPSGRSGSTARRTRSARSAFDGLARRRRPALRAPRRRGRARERPRGHGLRLRAAVRHVHRLGARAPASCARAGA